LIENPIIINDEDGNPTDRSYHTSHQMTVNDPGVESDNTEGDAGGFAQTGKVVANTDLDDAAMSQADDRPAIVAFTSSPEFLESDSGATLDEKRQLHLSA
jgi:hypothetical protein